MDENFRGVIIVNVVRKVSLFADATLLFLNGFHYQFEMVFAVVDEFVFFQNVGIIYLNHKPFLLSVKDKKVPNRFTLWDLRGLPNASNIWAFKFL